MKIRKQPPFPTPEEVIKGWQYFLVLNAGKPIPTGRFAEFVRECLHWSTNPDNWPYYGLSETS